MDNLIERLRDKTRLRRNHGLTGWVLHEEALTDEAANEIDRLRGLLREAGRRHADPAWQAAVWEALGCPGNHPNAINQDGAQEGER